MMTDAEKVAQLHYRLGFILDLLRPTCPGSTRRMIDEFQDATIDNLIADADETLRETL